MEMKASFETDRAGRYLEALCHHFGRRVDAACDETSGWVEFPFGRCELTAGAAALDLRVSAGGQAGLDRTVEVLTSHLERFAFRERPDLFWRSEPNPRGVAGAGPSPATR